MDGVHAVFESVLDLDAFSLRIRQDALDDNLPQLLRAISPDQVRPVGRLASAGHPTAATWAVHARDCRGIGRVAPRKIKGGSVHCTSVIPH